MNEVLNLHVLLSFFSIAYAAMNVPLRFFDGSITFSIAYAAMNSCVKLVHTLIIFSIAYAAMNLTV